MRKTDSGLNALPTISSRSRARACQSLEGFVVVEFAANEPDSLEQLFPHLLAEGGTSVLGYRVMNDLGEVLVLPVASGESHQPEPWW